MHNYNENATTFPWQQQITTNADNAFRNANQSGGWTSILAMEVDRGVWKWAVVSSRQTQKSELWHYHLDTLLCVAGTKKSTSN